MTITEVGIGKAQDFLRDLFSILKENRQLPKVGFSHRGFSVPLSHCRQAPCDCSMPGWFSHGVTNDRNSTVNEMWCHRSIQGAGTSAGARHRSPPMQAHSNREPIREDVIAISDRLQTSNFCSWLINVGRRDRSDFELWVPCETPLNTREYFIFFKIGHFRCQSSVKLFNSVKFGKRVAGS